MVPECTQARAHTQIHTSFTIYEGEVSVYARFVSCLRHWTAFLQPPSISLWAPLHRVHNHMGLF